MAVTTAIAAFPADTMWTSITAQPKDPLSLPYVPPLPRRSSSSLSHHSLQLCTENLGSETGSDSFSPEDELDYFSSTSSSSSSSDVEEEEEQRKEVAEVNYHCLVTRRTSPARPFPPPLTSISRADGSCISMRAHRRDGRLVLEAVPVPAKKYLHAERLGGRLLLSFVSTSSSSSSPLLKQAIPEEVEVDELPPMEEEDEEVEEEEEEEEEVEVVDRGTVVEVKLTPQPQPQGTAAVVKVHRSSLVINKFVGGTPPEPEPEQEPPASAATANQRQCSGGGTMAAAVAEEEDNCKLLFASKSRSRAELLHHMRRCSQLRQPLFFWEPCWIATSS